LGLRSFSRSPWLRTLFWTRFSLLTIMYSIHCCGTTTLPNHDNPPIQLHSPALRPSTWPVARIAAQSYGRI
jgi:hypothetical protein